ncbi:MAG: CAP domain-containing protein [Acidimicrobiia bacterium]
MNRPLLATVVVVVVAASAGAMAIISEPREEPSPSANAPVPASTTTTEPDFAALVASGVVTAVSEEEAELTEHALTRSTSTTTTTTTTPTTTTTVATTTTAPPRGSNPPTSPTTTQPPTTTTTQASTAGYLSGAENDFASRINSYRGSKGKASLTRDGSLNSYARSWAKHMAGQGSLTHSDLGSLLPPWGAAGENLGQGGSVSAIFDALVASSGHRANMLEDFTHMGIGVWRDSNGTLWTVHIFTR